MKQKILFVDDDQNILDGIKRMLHSRSKIWDMTYTASVPDAQAFLNEDNFDIAVLDIQMPFKSGLELLKEIKSDTKNRSIEVIIITGLQDSNLKQKALDLGAADLLNKPILKEDLIARLKSALRTKAYQDELQIQNSLLERQLQQSQKMEIVGLMAAGVAHDLNNLLTVIMGYGSLVESKLNDDSLLKKNMEKVHKASEHAQKIVRQIVSFSRKKEFTFETFDICQMIDDCVELLKSSFSNKIEIVYNRPAETQRIYADSTQIFQLLMNLIINSSQAMKSGGKLQISLSKTNKIPDALAKKHTIKAGLFLIIKISDTGPGMDQKTKAKIFEPLYTTKNGGKGSGLGLSIVQRIIKYHNGFIKVESSLGKGAAFYVYLPYDKRVLK